MWRIRGNPKVLATVVVALVALLAGIVVRHFFVNAEFAAGASGALFGATASALTGILAYVLGTVDTREVPLQFMDAARTDVLDIGYYKQDFSFDIRLAEENSTWKLIIEFRSKIVPVKAGAKMKLPLVIPPEKLCPFLVNRTPKITYTLDNQEWNLGEGFVELKDSKKEFCLIEYELTRKITTLIDDEHRSWCPIMGETVSATLPDNYNFSVVGLRGEADIRLSQTDRRGNSRKFQRAEAHFSHQGFKWELLPLPDC